MFLFSLTFLNVTHKSTYHTEIGAFNGAIVCVALFVGIISAAATSGAALNPAVALALNLGSKLTWDRKSYIAKLWIYFVGDLAGAALAGLLYAFFHRGCCAAITCPEEIDTHHEPTFNKHETDNTTMHGLDSHH